MNQEFVNWLDAIIDSADFSIHCTEQDDLQIKLLEQVREKYIAMSKSQVNVLSTVQDVWNEYHNSKDGAFKSFDTFCKEKGYFMTKVQNVSSIKDIQEIAKKEYPEETTYELYHREGFVKGFIYNLNSRS